MHSHGEPESTTVKVVTPYGYKGKNGPKNSLGPPQKISKVKFATNYLDCID